MTIITDPAFFDLPTRERRVSLPCDVTDLKGVDYLLISHDHRDHFDAKSVNQLVALNPEMKALMPLNGSQLLKVNGFDEISFQEAGWYQEYQLNENLRVIFLPARHWGRRGLNDQNRVLWGSFLIHSGNTKIYFGGDSGYGEHYKEIRELFGKINYCILPIGAYSPSYMMKTSHTTPEEALQAFIDLGGETFIPMHYGTYDLSDEPVGEPLQRLKNEARRLNISDKLKVLDIGEALSVNQGTESLEIVGYLN